jgi:hypothetical protein
MVSLSRLGPGLGRFQKMLQRWRDDGNMEGMRLDS